MIRFNELIIWNYYMLMVLGLIFEILGAIFLSLESIGFEFIKKLYGKFYSLSKWANKSTKRLLSLTISILMILNIILLFGPKVLLALFIPISFIITIIILTIANPMVFENVIKDKSNNNKLGPLGFIIMIIGFFFQLASIIWQMSISI